MMIEGTELKKGEESTENQSEEVRSTTEEKKSTNSSEMNKEDSAAIEEGIHRAAVLRTSREESEVFTPFTSVLQQKWNHMFMRLVDFKESHGHCLVPNRYASDMALGAWVSTQRRQYKVLVSGSSESTPMTPERAARLESIGFVWVTTDPRHVPWETRYRELCEYREKNGNCLVPIGFKENVKLANWVSTQRQEFKLLREGRTSRLSAERIKLLEDVGFVWEAQRGGPRRKRKTSEDEDEKADRPKRKSSSTTTPSKKKRKSAQQIMRKQSAIQQELQGLRSLQMDSQHLPSGISVTMPPHKVDTAHIVETAKRLAAPPSATAAGYINRASRQFAMAPPFAKGETGTAAPGGNPSFHSTTTTSSSQGRGGAMPAPGYSTFPPAGTMNPALTAKWQQNAYAQASRVKAFQEQARRVAFMRTQQQQTQGRGAPSPLVASSSQAEGATGSPAPPGLLMGGTQDTQIQAHVRAVMQQQAVIMQQQQLQAQALHQQQAQLAAAAQHIGETQGLHAATSSQALTVAISPAPAQPGASHPSSNIGAGAMLPAIAGSTPLQQEEGATAAGLGTTMPFPDGPDTITITVRAPNEVTNNHQGTNSGPSAPLVPSQGDIAPDNEDGGGIFDDAEE